MLGNALWFVLLGLAAGFLIMLSAPLEALGWWAGWYTPLDDLEAASAADAPGSAKAPLKKHTPTGFLVFLDGIAKATPDNYADVQVLLDKLAASLPHVTVIGDVLPYAASGVPLTRKRPLAKFWRYVRARKLRDADDPLGFAINLRNLSQVLVSADKRYGPLFHAGEGELIVSTLIAAGYQPSSGVPVTLLGYSGGAQIAAGVAPYLKHRLRAPVDLISLGGVLSADEGVNDLRYMYHLAGSRDLVEKLGAAFFPGRWAVVASSSWNRAKRKGKFTFIPLGPFEHRGPQGYLNESPSLPGGISRLEHTSEIIRRILAEPEHIHKTRVARGPLKFSYPHAKVKA